MNVGTSLAKTAALLGDPARARILAALMDGRSLTATELAYQAGVSPQTASSHLAKLSQAKFIAVEVEGRYRRYRLASRKVAHAIHALLAVAADHAVHENSASKPLAPIRMARTCYDHLAGRLGVALTQMMVRRKYLKRYGRDFRVTAAGEAFLRRLGVDVQRAKRQRRGFARQCLDWTEGQPHLAGALGAAFAKRWLELKWLNRVPGDRYLLVAKEGRKALRQRFRVKTSTLFT